MRSKICFSKFRNTALVVIGFLGWINCPAQEKNENIHFYEGSWEQAVAAAEVDLADDEIRVALGEAPVPEPIIG